MAGCPLPAPFADCNVRICSIVGGFSPSNPQGTSMLDHVSLEARDIAQSVPVFEAALAALGTNERFDYDGKMGCQAILISKASAQMGAFTCGCVRAWWIVMRALWPIAGNRSTLIMPRRSRRELRTRALPESRLCYDPRYHAANVADPDDYSIEFVYKIWQHSNRNKSTTLAEDPVLATGACNDYMRAPAERRRHSHRTLGAKE